MIKQIFRMKYLLVIIFLNFITLSCKHDNQNNHVKSEITKPTTKRDLFIVKLPINRDTCKLNKPLRFEIALNDTIEKFDSINLYVKGKLTHSFSELIFSFPLNPEKVGNNDIAIEVCFSNDIKQKKKLNLIFLSDITPKLIKYEIINIFPHSSENFTEGLVFHDNYIYEGTGDWGKSTLLKTDLKTGEILQSLSLSSDIFGEGITILNDKIIQLTYKSMEGYVYDKKSFRQILKFSYPIQIEGWGVTTDGKDLIMSNGTEKLFVLDSSYYSLFKEIQVCDNVELLDSLNELEFVNGMIYANIWMDNKIAQIEYKTGKVLGYIDLSEIVPVKYRNHSSNVLNGIALNSENGNLFVTGKRWTQLYEIKLD